MKLKFLLLLMPIFLLMQMVVVHAQDKHMPYCTQADALAVFNEFQNLNEKIASKITPPSDPKQYPEYFLYFYDLRDEWWTKKVPLFPQCVEIQEASYAFGYAMDQIIVTVGFVNTYSLEVQRGNTESASEFQKRSAALGSSKLFGKSSDGTIAAIEGLYALAYGNNDISIATSEPVATTTSSSLALFMDEFSDPSIVRQFEVSCPHDLYPVFYPTVTDQRPDKAIEFLASIEVIEMGDLSYGDVQNVFRDHDYRYPHITVGNISHDDVNTTNEFQEKYRRHELVFIPLPGDEFYRIENDQADYTYVWQKVSAADVKELFGLLNAPKCLEGLEFYGS